MKLTLSTVTFLALTSTASAFSTAARVSGARTLSAAALFGTSIEQAGETGTESFRLNFKEGDATISPWHDIPLKGEKGYNMVVEIPKMTKAKMEIATKEEGNPIAQDIKKGNLRDYHGPIFWNYGCLPQTWEDPNEEHPELKVFGDDGESVFAFDGFAYENVMTPKTSFLVFFIYNCYLQVILNSYIL